MWSSPVKDASTLVIDQYRDGRNLEARIRLHERCSTHPMGLDRWLLVQIDLPPRASVLELGLRRGGNTPCSGAHHPRCRVGTERKAPIIRPYRPQDHDALLGLADRLAIGIAPWRSESGMQAAARTWVTTSIKGIGPEGAVFVAEQDGAVIGFASVTREVAFTGEAQAYIGELAVAVEAEGQGVGQALLAAAEDWAREQDLPLLTLETGAANVRGRRFYARAGFQDESVRLTKVLTSGGNES